MRVGTRVGPVYLSQRVTGSGCLLILGGIAFWVVVGVIATVGNRYPAATITTAIALAVAATALGIYALVRHEKRANARRAADPYCRAPGPVSWTGHPGRPHLCGSGRHGVSEQHACMCGWRWA